MRRSLRYCSLVLALSLAGPAAAQSLAATDSAAQGGTLVYTSPQFHWSISYPADWTLDSTDAGWIDIRSKDGQGECGIHSGAVRFKTLDSFAKFLLDFSKRSCREKGLKFAIVSREQITLPDGIIAIDALTELRPGGKSRKVFALEGGTGFTIDCEAYAAHWPELEPRFDALIRSFRLGR